MKEITGIVQGVYSGITPGTLVTTSFSEVDVSFEGIAGDQHAGLTRRSDGRTPYYPRGTEIRNYRQVSIVSVEELAEIAGLLQVPELRPEWLGANLLLAGIPSLTLLPPRTRLFFSGGAVLEVESDNAPCLAPGKVLQAQYPGEDNLSARFVKSAYLKRGLVAWVEKPGRVASGSEVQLLIPRQYLYPENENSCSVFDGKCRNQ